MLTDSNVLPQHQEERRASPHGHKLDLRFFLVRGHLLHRYILGTLLVLGTK